MNIEHNMIEFLEDKNFKKLSNVKHHFFTRRGGVSSGYYDSLNCCYKGKDNPDHVRENRKRIMQKIGHPFVSLVTTENNHTNKVVIVDKPWAEAARPEADAMVTKLPQIVLGSDSADCPIVLFGDDKANVIGLAHAGWKGAKQGIIAETINKMIGLGATAHNISAVISPCIAQDSYEVSKDFYQNFLYENSINADYFKRSKKPNHFMFDLRAYVLSHLQEAQLKSHRYLDIDTYSDERFFSCRRTIHRAEPDFGGHFSCIYLS